MTLRPPHHSVYLETLRSSAGEEPALGEFVELVRRAFDRAFIVNIGSASLRLQRAPEGGSVPILNLDLHPICNVDLVADAHYLPFRDGIVPGLILKCVFEHVPHPFIVRDELKRVLRPGGYVYAKIPFLQPYHAAPDDFHRFTQNGVRELFRDFQIVREGVSVGPSSALTWLLVEYLGILFSFDTDRGYQISRTLWSYPLTLFKYLDVFFRNRRESHRLASAFYIIAQAP